MTQTAPPVSPQPTTARGGLNTLLAGVDVVDPYPLWQSLLEGDPITAPDGSFALLTRHADIDAVLRSPLWSAERSRSTLAQEALAQMSPEEQARMARQRSFLFMDAPDHTRLRRLVSKAFTPKTVEGLQPLVEQLSRDLLDAAVARGRLEMVADVSYPLPVIVISRMLGVPEEDHERFAAWSDVLAAGLDDGITGADDEALAARRHAADSFRAYFADLVEQRRAEPREDLLSALVAVRDEGDRLSHDELMSTVVLLLIAGHETTVNLISNGTLALLRDDDLRARVAADPSLAAGVVEEVLRLDPPVQMTGRVATQDLPVPGGVVKAGGSVLCLLAAAGRDPQHHEDPLRFDPSRTTPHLALSAGPHYCLGAPLARLEARTVLADLARRLVAPRLGELSYRENRVLRGPAVLEVLHDGVVD